MKWAMLDDKVFELNEFTHPGGNFILNEIQGREVGRFIYGSYPLESVPEATLHKHSSHALLAMEKNLIGTFQYGQKILTPLIVDSDINNLSMSKGELNLIFSMRRDTAQKLLAIPKSQGEWILEKKMMVTPLVAKFEFRSRNYFINPFFKDIRRLGRHMKVSHISHDKIRLYTLVLSQTEARSRKREILWNQFVKKDANPSIINDVDDSRFETLPLLIKNYAIPNVNTLSNFLHNCEENTRGFIIDGPYGHGLGLTPESTGLHYIYVGGTGIFPFLDLFDYLLESILDPKHGKNLFQNGFKLHVFAAFAQMSEFVAIDMCEKLIQVCQQTGIKDGFKLTVRAQNAQQNNLYNVTRERFDAGFVERNTERGCEKVFVCGPPQFNQIVPAALAAIGISKSKIVLV